LVLVFWGPQILDLSSFFLSVSVTLGGTVKTGNTALDCPDPEIFAFLSPMLIDEPLPVIPLVID